MHSLRLLIEVITTTVASRGIGVCYDFQNKGHCRRGENCHFSHCAFVFRKHTIMKAIERGIQFELSYANAFSDTSSRRHFLSNLIALSRATGGRHLILSSGTPHSIFLRSPYAVIHMAKLAGLSSIQATASISSNPQRLIERIDQRRL